MLNYGFIKTNARIMMDIVQEIKNIKSQLEILKLKQMEADKPKAKTGRVLSIDDLDLEEQYYLSSSFSNGNITAVAFSNHPLDFAAINSGSAFHDEETAKKELERKQLMQTMRTVADKDGKVDWIDRQSNKLLPFWDYHNGRYDIHDHGNSCHSSLPHFKNRERLIDFMNSLTVEHRKLLICGVD